jgi:hypothetical protein
MRIARVLPESLAQFGNLPRQRRDLLLERRDPQVLRRILRPQTRILGFELRDPIVGRGLLHAQSHRRSSARWKAPQDNGTNWITYAASPADSPCPRDRAERLLQIMRNHCLASSGLVLFGRSSTAEI